MKKIVVTQRIDYIKKYDETRESIDQALSKWLINLNFLPIPISNKLVTITNDKKIKEEIHINNWLSSVSPDALVLSGGNNIGEYDSRDQTEFFLLNWAKSNSIPVLGICRGMQIMAIYSGVKLKVVNNHINTKHQLNIIKSIDNWPKEVNSYHKWALCDCPDGFKVEAHSKDGVIEAIKHKELNWEGWMWHPERELPFCDVSSRRLKDLFNN